MNFAYGPRIKDQCLLHLCAGIANVPVTCILVSFALISVLKSIVIFLYTPPSTLLSHFHVLYYGSLVLRNPYAFMDSNSLISFSIVSRTLIII
jgi:hypothetical protein